MRNKASDQELQCAASALMQLKKNATNEKKTICIDLTIGESDSVAPAHPIKEPAVKESHPICIDLTLSGSDDEEPSSINASGPASTLPRSAAPKAGAKELGAAAIDVKSASEPADLSDEVSTYENYDSGSTGRVLNPPKVKHQNNKRVARDMLADSPATLGANAHASQAKKLKVDSYALNNRIDGTGAATEISPTSIDNLPASSSYSLDNDSVSISSFPDPEDTVLVGKDGLAATAHFISHVPRKSRGDQQFSNLCDDIRQAAVNSMSKYHNVYLAASDIIANKGNLNVLKPGCTPNVLKALKHVLSQDIVAEEKANSSLDASAAGPALVSSAAYDAGAKGTVKVREQVGAKTPGYKEYTRIVRAAYPNGAPTDCELEVVGGFCFLSSSSRS